MAVQSPNVSVGTPLPTVTLPDLEGKPVDLDSYREGGPLVVVFTANHCPYVRHIESALGVLAAQFPSIRFVSIVSNDLENYPSDDVAGAADQAARAGWDFPTLMDRQQTAAQAFGAACTPDFFVFDRAGALAYRGAFDTSTPKNGEAATGELLGTALKHLIADEAVPLPHRPALGCGIKWLPGNEPEAINFL
jgi:thiol-disulfide isomerase/thioredoxin